MTFALWYPGIPGNSQRGLHTKACPGSGSPYPRLPFIGKGKADRVSDDNHLEEDN